MSTILPAHHPSDNHRHKRDKEEMVLTPGGYRPRSRVHIIEENDHILSRQGHFFIVESATNRLKELIHCPKMHSSARRSRKGPSNLAAGPFMASPAPVLNNGWVAFAEWFNDTGQPLSQFVAQWTVPPPPSMPSNQTIFIFIGIQNRDYIMQPVLQWGPSAAGGGQYWSIANWYAGRDIKHTFCHECKPVSSISLTARIQLIKQSDRSFKYSASFDNFPSLDWEQDNVTELTFANVALETYNLTDRHQYPKTNQTAIEILKTLSGVSPDVQSIDPAWQPAPQQPVAGQPNVIIGSGGKTINLNYG